jgi:flagellar hook-associated protein 3
MDLRVTPQTLTSIALANLDSQTTQLSRLQEQASTGKKLIVPSDDPLDIAPLLASQTQDSQLTEDLANLQTARTSLQTSTSALQQAHDVFTQARTIALEGSQSTNYPTGQLALAQQVDGLISQLLSIANTQNNGSYLFAGTATKTKPFVVTTNSQGVPQSVTYQGADSGGAVPIGSQSVDTLYSGQDIFQGLQRGSPIYSGDTSAAPGTGTDSATGQGTLLVRHTTTTFAAGSGVQAGTGSAAGDTIIGPAGAHHLTIVDTSGTGAAGTVSLDGDPPVNFSNTDTNLQVTGPNGQIVYLNTTAITPAFNGTVDITANGTLSVDGGATTAPIDFSANQVVTDSATGAVTNVNSSNIRGTGTALIDRQGAYDAFQSLMQLRDELRNVNGLPEQQQLDAVSNSVAELDRVGTNVSNALGAQSASLQSLDTIESHMQSVQLNTKTQISNLQNVDLSQIIIQLQAQQNQLQLTLAASARLFDQSLLDFLR